ncbi:MAG: YicC family protein [Candidatus Latescibacteria bacterium]|nr:YicC family protein [Candidatus Latescibacterota bacterium]
MIRSMTGFGRSEYTENGTHVTAEVSSVNGRFFDLKVKMPKSIFDYEGDLRKIAQKYIDRGRVTISINLDQPGLKADKLKVDYETIDLYIKLAEEISSRYGIENNIDVRTFLGLSEIIQWEENGFDPESMWVIIKEAVILAFKAHQAMRENEGATVGKDISNRLEVINSFINEIEKKSPEAVKANSARLRKKIENFIGTKALDENRFAMEVALYADRVDITEECVRLRSHCDQFKQELECDKTSGRKLSFLLQEMNREANTIGSKVLDAPISQKVVLIKEELEKMREQGANIE